MVSQSVRYMMDIVILNAFMIYNKTHADGKLTLRAFRENLSSKLIDGNSYRKSSQSSSAANDTRMDRNLKPCSTENEICNNVQSAYSTSWHNLFLCCLQNPYVPRSMFCTIPLYGAFWIWWSRSKSKGQNQKKAKTNHVVYQEDHKRKTDYCYMYTCITVLEVCMDRKSKLYFSHLYFISILIESVKK